MKKYDITKLKETVSVLIKQKLKGIYWDFKQEWHFKHQLIN